MITGLRNRTRYDVVQVLSGQWILSSPQEERNWFIGQLQAFAKDKRARVTFLSGDVHCAAVGVLKSRIKGRKHGLPPTMDFRYMLNVVTSELEGPEKESVELTPVGRCNREYSVSFSRKRSRRILTTNVRTKSTE